MSADLPADELNSSPLSKESIPIEAVFLQAPAAICVLTGPELTFVLANERYQQLVGRSDLVGKPIVEALPELVDHHIIAVLRNVFDSGERFIGNEYPMPLDRTGTGTLETGYFNFVYEPLRDAAGSTQGIFVHAVDVTELVEAQQRSARLVAELSVERDRLVTILDQMPSGVAIALAPSGELILSNAEAERIFHHPMLRVEDHSVYDRYGALYLDGSPYASEDYPIARALLLGETVHGEEMGYRRMDGTETFLSVNAAPLRDAQGNILAAVTTFQDISARKQAEAEREHLLTAEREARAGAEHVARRQALLASVSRVLSGTLDEETLLLRVAGLPVPDLADCAILDVLGDDGELQRAGLATSLSLGSEVVERIRRSVSSRDAVMHPAVRAITTLRPVFFPQLSISERTAIATSSNHLSLLNELGATSLIAVPLVARGRALGSLVVVYVGSSQRTYTAEDVAALEDLAARVAQAIENARLFERSEQARAAAERSADRTQRLLNVTVALAEAVTREDVAEVGLRESIAAVGGAAGGLGVLVDGGERLERLAMLGYPQAIVDATRFTTLDDLGPIGTTARTGQAVWLETNEQIFSLYPNLAALPERRNYGAAASVPLLVGGAVTGVLSLRFMEERPFDADDRDLITAIAGQCAQALERARLLNAERAAREAAESAVRSRDEFLSIASHELKTPVAALKGSAQLLLRWQARGDLPAERLMRSLRALDATTNRLTELTNDLLDVSRLRTGNLQLDLHPTDVMALVEEAFQRSTDQIEDIDVNLDSVSRHSMTLSASPNLPAVALDTTRMYQVIANLLDNAVKYSPDGGAIEVIVSEAEDGVVVAVRDEGMGLPAGTADLIFEPFGRAMNAAASNLPGMGLGLYICRSIVERHGGRIWAESAGEGLGTTLRVWLPAVEQ